MENQHRKIKGYRELSQEEIDLMNRIKEKGQEVGELISELNTLTHENLTGDQSSQRLNCVEYATKDLKQGVMWLVRAVALPDSF